MKNVIKTSVLAALLAVSANASATTAVFNLNFIANNNFGLAPSSVGTVTVTDLSDLVSGGDGVRVTVNLNGLSQFSDGKSNGPWISSYEMNFNGTDSNGNDNFKNISGIGTNDIEWEENGCVGYGTNCGPNGNAVNGWGGNPTDPAFGQEINFASGAFTHGQTSVIDYLNGGVAGYTGFSVASLLANPVSHNTDANAPDAYFWIRIRGDAGGLGMASSGYWGNSITNSSGSSLNYRLNVLATTYTITAVPEAETYAMMMAGLGLIGTIVRRRKTA